MTGRLIDLRSDTVTRPTPGMRAAMAAAEVGDDVFGEDPTVARLQDRVAEMFGVEAALFTPTGSMANVLAVGLLVQPGQEVLCEARAHIVRAELGAHGALSGITTRTWASDQGQIDLAAIEATYAPDLGPFFVTTKAISVENTHNFAGGTVLPWEELQVLRTWADRHHCTIHLDGARIWNASVATGVPLAAYGRIADTASVCLSKGLGAPVGSLVLGTTEAIAEARVRRKRLGGGMRQVGVLAAAGLYALDHHIDRLALDHANAQVIADAVGSHAQTNIVVIDVENAPEFVAAAKARGVLVGAVGINRVRALTHLDVSAEDADQAAQVLASLL